MALFGKRRNDAGSLGDVPPPGMPPDMNAMPQQGPQDYYNQQPPGMQDMNQMPPDAGQFAPDLNQNMPPPDMGQMPEGMPPDYGQPEQGFNQQPSFPSPQFQQPFPAVDDTKERVEEIAEAIIDEKWNELIKDINKVIEWKERTDTELKRVTQEVENLKERFDALHKGVLGKITEYDQNLTTVGSEIKAMEMAFQKILPSFIENINKLDRIVKSTGSKK